MKWYDAIELVLFLVFATGVSLLAGQVNVVVGVGAGLMVFAAAALAWVLAFQLRQKGGG